ncbi:MAG: YncE family protein, partial [Chitinophagaceae bacterium]
IKMKKYLYIVSSLLLYTSCKEKMKEEEVFEIGIKPCKKAASFIKTIGFDANRAAFSTSHNQYKGVVLIQAPNTPTDSLHFYQDSSWKQFGYMGSLTTDKDGNTYTANIPLVNNLDYAIMDLNRIYKIDAITGKMEVFFSLPKADSINDVVPYGILGLYYDCHANKLYVSSVSGSTRNVEKGIIYVIDMETKQIVDDLKGFDAMGVFVGGNTGEKRLYFGSARTSKLFSTELNKDGTFSNKDKVSTDLTLDNLGPRGNDKIRRIRYDKFGNLTLYAIEFNFSLAAPTQKPETGYQFNFDDIEKKWFFKKILE